MSEAIVLLKSIDATLKAILQKMKQPAGGNQGKAVASEAELLGKYGDPEVRFDPRDWTGPSFKKRKMSDCPAEFLELYADAKEYFGRKAEEENKLTSSGKPAARYEFADAARARGWAKRIREGKHMPTTEPVNGWTGGTPWAADADDRIPVDDDIAF